MDFYDATELMRLVQAVEIGSPARDDHSIV